MKRVITSLTAFLFVAILWAQAPEKMSYQAIIRNSSNVVLANTQVGMQISILQGSANGKVFYSETQLATTNENGLVSIEIGGGVVQDGDFSTIDWSNGPYFIQIETDPDGGTKYSIIGTSQLLSVPYALHAKTAESIIGSMAETDPLYSGSNAANITANDIGKLSKLSGTNTGDQDGSETKVTAGSSITVTGSGTNKDPYVLNSTAATTLTIGQSYQGGIIFWLDATGQHGLIAATVDQGVGVWSNVLDASANAVRDGIGGGIYNTEQIMNQGAGGYAAKLCAIYKGGGYGDWYLPSKYELNLLFQQKAAVGGFATDYYWSSSEVTGSNYIVWLQSFVDGIPNVGYKDYPTYVRAIRSF